MAVYFQHIRGSKKGEIESFTQDTIQIGRLAVNDLIFGTQQDREVSGKHAKIFFDGNAYLIEDLDSSNGTYVNNQRTDHPTPLHEGDVIELSLDVQVFLA